MIFMRLFLPDDFNEWTLVYVRMCESWCIYGLLGNTEVAIFMIYFCDLLFYIRVTFYIFPISSMNVLGLEKNHSIKSLSVDHNELGNAGRATLDAFARSLMVNHSLRVLFFDTNKLGPEWGVRLADVLGRNNSLVQVSLRDNRYPLGFDLVKCSSFSSRLHVSVGFD